MFDVGTGDFKERGNGIKANRNGTSYSVDLSDDGSTVAISNYYSTLDAISDENDALDVRTFTFSSSEDSWAQLGETLHAFEPGNKDGYFISISNDGRVIAMGDPGRVGSSGGGNTGHAHIYVFDDAKSSWSQLGPDVTGAGAGDHFGYDVVISGDGRRFAASAPFSRALGTRGSHGRVTVYKILRNEAQQ